MASQYEDNVIVGLSTTVVLNGDCHVHGNIFIAGTLTHSATYAKQQGVRLTATGNITVAETGKITADMLSSFINHESQQFGSYGGLATSEEETFGSLTAPDDLGSAGQDTSVCDKTYASKSAVSYSSTREVMIKPHSQLLEWTRYNYKSLLLFPLIPFYKFSRYSYVESHVVL